MPSSDTQERRSLADYPASLQSAARALWGDDFWGRHQPRAKAPEPLHPRKRG
jgi:hypothetical protein